MPEAIEGLLPGYGPRLAMIRLAAFDVDGTLTDGGIYLDGEGGEWKRFDVQDGMGLSLLARSGVILAIISGRYSPVTERRARELGIEHCANGVGEKLPVLRDLARKLGISPEEIAFLGDDVNDLACITWAGLGMAVQNALPEVQKAAKHVTHRSGGAGAVREAAEYILAYNRSEGA
jgi:3-deoxy-D-manno-octulosonate 8-phosphate phosphatase (KDO 8-P phosphatase)